MNKKTLLYILPILLVFFIALTFVFILSPPVKDTAEAYDVVKDEINISAQTPPTLLINDTEYTDVINLYPGEEITLSVLYRGKYYIPTITVDEPSAAFSINGGTLSIIRLSKLGELFIYVNCIFEDNSDFNDIVLVNITVDNQKLVAVNENGFGSFVDLSPNVEYVVANATIDTGENYEVQLHNGDDLDEVFSFAPHKSSGVTLDYQSIGLITSDNNGNEYIEEEQNGSWGINLFSTATQSLYGAGTLGNPYQIYDEFDFHIIKNYDSEENYTYFKQYSDFTMSTTFEQFHFYGEYSSTSSKITIDNLNNGYSALFRKNYGTIKNLTIYVKSLTLNKVGFVGVVCTQNLGTILGVNVEIHPDLINNSFNLSPVVTFNPLSFAGGIAGSNNAGGLLRECNTSLRVNGVLQYGGICSSNTGNVNNCKAITTAINVTLNSLVRVGGLVASNGSVINLPSSTSNPENNNTGIIVFFAEPTSTSIESPYLGGIIAYNTAPLANIGFDPNNLPSNLNLLFAYNRFSILDEIHCNAVIGYNA